MSIERATPDDVPAVEALLVAAGLPLDGAADALVTGVVARDGDAVVGAAAVEPHGDAGLLRSVVVAADRRGTGLGRALVSAAEDLARGMGERELYLLTDTAAGWFHRLGYEVVDREMARGAIGDSIEFTMVCATSGVAMRRELVRMPSSPTRTGSDVGEGEQAGPDPKGRSDRSARRRVVLGGGLGGHRAGRP